MAKKKGKGSKGGAAPRPKAFSEGDVLVSRTDDWCDLVQHILSGVASDGSPEAFPGGKLDPLADWILRPQSGSAHRKLLETVKDVAARIIMESGEDPEIGDLMDRIAGKVPELGTDRPLLSDLVRCHVAAGDLIAVKAGKRSPKTVVMLADWTKDSERSRAYAASFVDEIKSQSERIGNLVSHSLTAGTYREDLLRTLFRRYIPRRYHVATGFVHPSPRQQDIIVYDQIDHSPLFRDGDLVVVMPSAVRAVIEVKTTLDNAALTEALEILAAVPQDGDSPPVFKGIFGFSRPTKGSLAKRIADFYSSTESETFDEMDAKTIHRVHDPVTAVCVMDETLLSVGFHPRTVGGDAIEAPAITEIGSVAGRASQATMFFHQLARHLRHPFDGPQTLEGIWSLLKDDLEDSKRHWIHKGLWGPYLHADIEPDIVETIERRAANYRSWLYGRPWRS